MLNHKNKNFFTFLQQLYLKPYAKQWVISILYIIFTLILGILYNDNCECKYDFIFVPCNCRTDLILRNDTKICVIGAREIKCEKNFIFSLLVVFMYQIFFFAFIASCVLIFIICYELFECCYSDYIKYMNIYEEKY